MWLITFFTIWFVSTFHILNIKFNLNYDYNSNHFSYSLLLLSSSRGKSNLSLNLDYAYDHYFWLKKSAWEIFKNNINGIGNKNFSKEVKQLEEKNYS